MSKSVQSKLLPYDIKDIKKVIALQEMRLQEGCYSDWGLLVYKLKRAILVHHEQLSLADKKFIKNKIAEHNLALGKKLRFLQSYKSLLKS